MRVSSFVQGHASLLSAIIYSNSRSHAFFLMMVLALFSQWNLQKSGPRQSSQSHRAHARHKSRPDSNNNKKKSVNHGCSCQVRHVRLSNVLVRHGRSCQGVGGYNFGAMLSSSKKSKTVLLTRSTINSTSVSVMLYAGAMMT
jgi:hypothetical protein